MKGCILQSAPGVWYDTLVSVLAPIFSKVIALVAAIIADLSETERVLHGGNRKVDKNKEIKGKQTKGGE